MSDILTIKRTHHVNVVTSVLSKAPQPFLQLCASTQLPAKPQSLAAMTVVGQNPHIPLIVSTLQAKPEFAVRGRFGSPSA